MQPLRRIIGYIAVLAFLGGGYVQAAGMPFIADSKSCVQPTEAQLHWLEASVWGPFAEYTRVCKVPNGKGPPALLLISVWADLYYADKPSGAETVAMPKPLLFTPDGNRVGELPVNFPSDPPSELVVRFANRRQGLPYEIELCVATPTASGDQQLPPLRYNPATKRYEQASSAIATVPLGDCHGR